MPTQNFGVSWSTKPPFRRALHCGRQRVLKMYTCMKKTNTATNQNVITFYTFAVQYRSKVSFQSRLVSLEMRVSSRETRDSLKRQFWNKLQANCLARSRLQYCAKVMRTNFALFSSKYRRTIDRYFTAFVRQLKRNFGNNSPRQAKNRIKKPLLRIFEVGKYRRKFTSNQMKCPPTFRRPINMNSHGKT